MRETLIFWLGIMFGAGITLSGVGLAILQQRDKNRNQGASSND